MADPEQRAESPSFLERAYPASHYEEVILQLHALRELGYPVGFKGVSRPSAQQTGNTYRDWQARTYKRWLKPRFLDPEFAGWVTPIDTPEKIKQPDAEAAKLLSKHPAMIVPFAIEGLVDDTEEYLEYFETHGELKDIAPISTLPLDQALLQKLFMTAYERVLFYEKYGFVQDDEPKILTQHRYSELVEAGQKSAHPDEIKELVKDHYRLAGLLFPQMATFQKH